MPRTATLNFIDDSSYIRSPMWSWTFFARFGRSILIRWYLYSVPGDLVVRLSSRLNRVSGEVVEGDPETIVRRFLRGLSLREEIGKHTCFSAFRPSCRMGRIDHRECNRSVAGSHLSPASPPPGWFCLPQPTMPFPPTGQSPTSPPLPESYITLGEEGRIMSNLQNFLA